MNTTHTSSKLYLVRHGEAKSKEEDPERGLTGAGHAAVTRMAAWARSAGIQVGEIRHSGKTRATQTAAIFAAHFGLEAQVVSGLAPNDDVAPIAKSFPDADHNLMLVGHLPFLERLAGLLILGDSQSPVVRLAAGSLLELSREGDRWAVTCLMQPEGLPAN